MEKVRRIVIVAFLLLLCALPVAALEGDAWVRIVVPGAQWSPYQDAWVLPVGPLRFELQASTGGWDRMLVSARKLPVADWDIGALLIRPYHMRLEPGAGRFLVLPIAEVCPSGLYEVKAVIYRGERRLLWDVKYIYVTMLTAGRGYDVFPMPWTCMPGEKFSPCAAIIH